MRHRRPYGFTLIELMVVVTIVAILAGIAIPSYREHVKRSNRTQAKSALLENAQFMERNRTSSNKYDFDGAGVGITADNLPVKTVPKEGGGKTLYNIKFVDKSPTETAFALIAEPVANGPMAGDKCGTLTLNEQGTKGLTGAANGVTTADCWNR
jgi:type IV pilus assembly protein PilE